MHVGTIVKLWRYPIKSLAAQALTDAVVEPDGFAGDRQAALVVGTAGHARSGKTYRGKEHPRLHTVATAAEAQALGSSAGVALDVATGTRYFDAGAVSLLWDIWLHDVERLVGRDLDPLRYRPNVFVQASAEFSGREEALIGATLAIGDVLLEVVAPIRRCVTTTYDLRDGSSDPTVLRAVAQHRDNTVGVYASVVRGGRIACGAIIERR